MKIFSILTAVGLAMTLAACGSSSSGGDNNKGNPFAPGQGNNNGNGNNNGTGGGAGTDGGTNNPVGKPGPAGAFSCYISAADEFTGCVDVPADMVGNNKEQAKASCLQQATPAVNVVWNDAGCSQEHLVGTCIDNVTKLKMRYYFLTEEKAREICQQANPQNSFTTTY